MTTLIFLEQTLTSFNRNFDVVSVFCSLLQSEDFLHANTWSPFKKTYCHNMVGDPLLCDATILVFARPWLVASLHIVTTTFVPCSDYKVSSAQTSETQSPTLNISDVFHPRRVVALHFLLALLSFLAPPVEIDCILWDVNTLQLSLFLSRDSLYHFVKITFKWKLCVQISG